MRDRLGRMLSGAAVCLHYRRIVIGVCADSLWLGSRDYNPVRGCDLIHFQLSFLTLFGRSVSPQKILLAALALILSSHIRGDEHKVIGLGFYLSGTGLTLD